MPLSLKYDRRVRYSVIELIDVHITSRDRLAHDTLGIRTLGGEVGVGAWRPVPHYSHTQYDV